MPDTFRDFSSALYVACLQQPDKLWTQEDLFSLEIVPRNDLEILMGCVNTLYHQRRLIPYQRANSNKHVWKVVKREDAARYKGLTQEESVVLSYVDNSQQEGIWIRHIRSRSGLSQNSVNNALKKLEQKGVVKQITSARNPARKHYMLAHLQPSEDVTGGPFFTDGSLDEDYVFQISKIVSDFIKRQSEGQNAETRVTSHNVMESSTILRSNEGSRLPIGPDYTNYPNLSEITSFVNSHGVSSIRLVESDIKQLLDLLCWDGIVTKYGENNRYRSVRKTSNSFREALPPSLIDTPCARCPIFERCEDGGPINAETCAYLEEWLSLGSTHQHLDL